MTEKPKHSRFAPSKMHRRIACPGSAHIDNKDKQQSEFAKEGTLAHDFAASLLEDPLFRDEKISDEMLNHVMVYVNYCNSLSGDHYIETQIAINSISDEIYGTADHVVVDEWAAHLDVVELKYGAGKIVEVENNAQLATYALGALERFRDYQIETVSVTVVQPRIDHKDGPIRTWNTTAAELKKTWYKKIAKAYKTAIEKPTLYRDGPWCMWCSGAWECTKAVNKAKAIEKASKKGEKISADNKKLAKLLLSEQLVLQYLNDAKQLAFERLVKGEKIPGFKLIKSYGRLNWKNQKEAEKILAEKALIIGEEVFKETLKTPTQLKKMGFDESLIDRLSHQPEKGLILVSEDDKRQEYQGAKSDFDDEMSQGPNKGENV